MASFAEQVFTALAEVTEVDRLGSLYEPAESQHIKEVLSTLISCLAYRRKAKALIVDLAGRSLAEYWSVVAWITIPGRRPPVHVIVHDAPSLVGNEFLFAVLDQRGGRRLAKALKDQFGDRISRSVLERCARVICLSDMGADALVERYGIPRPSVVPHPARPPIQRLESPGGPTILFCPGHTALGPVSTVLRSVAALPLSLRGSILVKVGSIAAADGAAIVSLGKELGVMVEVIGQVDEDTLWSLFAEADVVCRLFDWIGGRSGNWAAVSGVLFQAAAAGAAICSNDSGGARAEFERRRAALFVQSEEELRSTLSRLLVDPALRQELRRNAQALAKDHSSDKLVATLLEPTSIL